MKEATKRESKIHTLDIKETLCTKLQGKGKERSDVIKGTLTEKPKFSALS